VPCACSKGCLTGLWPLMLWSPSGTQMCAEECRLRGQQNLKPMEYMRNASLGVKITSRGCKVMPGLQVSEGDSS
jgi:hypothetical protein